VESTSLSKEDAWRDRFHLPAGNRLVYQSQNIFFVNFHLPRTPMEPLVLEKRGQWSSSISE